MSRFDFVFRPFEAITRPLDLPNAPLPTRGPAALVLHFAHQFRGVLALVALLMMAIEGFNLVILWGISFVVDGVGTQGAAAFLAERWPVLTVLGLILFPLTPLLIFFANSLNVIVVSVGMPIALQWQSHKAVEGHDLGFFQDMFAGQVASRIEQAASALQQQVAVAFYAIPGFLMQFVGSLVLLAALSAPLALPVIFWIVANVALAVFAVPHFAETSRRAASARSMVVGAMTDLYANIQMVKLFAAEDSEAGAIRGVMSESVTTQQKERRILLSADTAVVVLSALLILSNISVGIWGLIAGFITTGEFVASIAIVQRLNANSRAFLGLGQQIFQAMGTIRDAMPVITTPPTIVDVPDAQPLKVTEGKIEFHNLQFEYRKDQGVIRDLSLTIRPGEKVGLVGLSGAGKSTLINLLLRFFDIDAGAIRIDGQDIRNVAQSSLRNNIGVVTQDIALLHRSIGDNIRYGRPGASHDEIADAAARAEAAEFIAGLSDSEGRTGYDAFAGDRGLKLSGGQRQRVAIARVLLKDAPILVLDEATSALDSEAEAAVQNNLAEMMEGKTVIAIAHRLSTIASMDTIVVLDKGRIVEQGPPALLLESKGLYAKLWARQTGGYIPQTMDEA